MKQRKILRNQKGFTLIEIIAVLIILGILASVAIHRFIDLEATSKRRAIDSGISGLNGSESLTWADQKISVIGFIDDTKVQEAMDYNLGSDYTWDHGPEKDHGTLNFKGVSVPLLRTESTISQPGVWSPGTFH
jgi:prepilin-type N-terminal cleavage/methylation domain-containing protein